MSRERIERLHYYQRQYLGAGDFEAQQDYHRRMRRRHNLGPHTWGIVGGLELVELEQEGGGGGVDVFVLPGVAIDGFGREIVVLAPYRLEGALFEPFRNQADRFLPVWIAYDEELTQRPRAGYELCDEDDQFARVRETFRVVIDPAPPFHDDLVVAGHRPAPGERPDAAAAEDVSTLLAVPRDASVPHQELPDDEDRPRWLVRLGNVHWDGLKLVPDDADPPLLNQDRAYVAAVAEQVLAPQGRLVLRHRWSPEVLPAKDEPDGADDADFGVQAELQGSLIVERRVAAKADLLVEGDAGIGTADPDVRLHVDGGVDAALADGTGYLVIGDVEATNVVFDDNEIQARNAGAISALHLQAEGGDLVIHQPQADAYVVVKEDGNVGVGVANPKVKLQIEGGTDAKLDEEEAGFLVIGSPAGVNLALDNNEILARNAAGKSSLHLQADGGDLRIHDNQAGTKVAVRDSGRVGIGTTSPDVKLHVDGGSDASLANGSGFLVLGETGGLNVVLDDNEIIARNDGLPSTLHVQAEGGDFHIHRHLATDREVVIKDSGRVGIGTTDPQVKLHVVGTVRANSFVMVSDARWKKNVATLEPRLTRLGALRGVRFEWRREELPEMGFEAGPQLGLVAQEVEEVFPELVRTDREGNKAVDVLGLVPVLLEAVKELAVRLEILEQHVPDTASQARSRKAGRSAGKAEKKAAGSESDVGSKGGAVASRRRPRKKG